MVKASFFLAMLVSVIASATPQPRVECKGYVTYTDDSQTDEELGFAVDENGEGSTVFTANPVVDYRVTFKRGTLTVAANGTKTGIASFVDLGSLGYAQPTFFALTRLGARVADGRTAKALVLECELTAGESRAPARARRITCLSYRGQYEETFSFAVDENGDAFRLHDGNPQLKYRITYRKESNTLTVKSDGKAPGVCSAISQKAFVPGAGAGLFLAQGDSVLNCWME